MLSRLVGLTLAIARSGVVDLVGRPGAREQLLQLVQCISAHGATLPARHGEAHGAIERRHLGVGQRPRDLLGKPETRDAVRAAIVALLHVVVDPRLAIPHEQHVGKRGKALALRG